MNKYVDIYCFKPAVRNKLIQLHKNLRVEFAQRYLHLTEEEWRRTVFIDEKVFSTHKDGRVLVWRPKNTRYEEKYILPRSWSGRATKCFFGWVCGYTPGALVPVDRKLNSEGYVDLLEDVFVPTINQVFGNQCAINVIEDNCAIHTAHIVRNWWRDDSRFNRLELPPRSPEINIIENVWAEMVREWRPTMATTEAQLIARVEQTWESLRNNLEYFQKLTDSIPRRLQKIIDKNGSGIRY
ncbi:hypothetical protein TKK_0014277 [Trichogramma kaykai]